MKNGWKKICRCRKGQMLKGIVLTLTLAFLTMGLCGCAEKHDAAEELEPIEQYVINNQPEIKALERLLGEVRKAERKHENRIYIPKSQREATHD